ncbi:flavin-containing monooxygenase [Kineosporia succinea]|uniref:Cation diffusion facilitator CzcD-associated flavoprotein CzcO n=1 Tax=Kineosporia succinea TaxID=84632 RepID=A0ABT9PD34_9ACTN|nr:NAD(P)/FAD-dependent oxidoreductase [Kineosporia succinea]MDP9830605.1 cation diffusion facilitator CzcD-associated flavoprotein CzcO [Kineosporia succinea]
MVSPGSSDTDLDGIDIEALRARYAHERDRRTRSAQPRQYRSAAGEFGYYAKDPYIARLSREPVDDQVDALVIGAGFGGLLTGAALREAGLGSVRLVDEAGDVGGTWYWNRYPGIHCDIEASVYMPLLEEVGTTPSMRYAPGEEIRLHAVALAERYKLYEHALFQTRVTALTWRDDTQDWVATTDRGDRVRARFVVVSPGTLTQPKLPGIPGIETFRGHTFHTSRWDYAYTGGSAEGGLTGLRDRRVAVIGTGATGLQVVPHLGRDAGHLYVFQRTPSTVGVRANRPLDQEWFSAQKPGWQRERMNNFLAAVTGEPVPEDLIDDGWTRTARAQRTYLSGVTDASAPEEELLDARVMESLRDRVAEVVRDPATAEILKPWYRYMCKRPGFSDEYLETFNRPNVTLVDTADTGGVTRMTETGVVVGETEYAVDCVIFATGFDVGRSGVVTGALPVTGRGGQALLETWRGGPKTLHGFCSPGFPNLFHLGSMQNANSVNFVHILQQQAEHIGALVARALNVGAVRVEPREDDAVAWVRTIEEVSVDTRAFQAECTPGYYNGEGRTLPIRTFSPGPVAFHRLLGQWRETSIDDVLVVGE